MPTCLLEMHKAPPPRLCLLSACQEAGLVPETGTTLASGLDSARLGMKVRVDSVT